MNDSGLCGSVLISKRFVLTAAHCVGAAEEFEIGITNINDGGYRYAWKRKRVHPRYDDVTLENDVVVYELMNDVKEDIPFVRLGKSRVTPGTELTVVGFGDTDENDDDDDGLDDDLPDTNVLLSLEVPYVPTPFCEEDFDENDDDEIVSPDMLCAGGEFGRGFCDGDSGGPLVEKGESPSEDVLVGIVSWSYDCAGDTPGGYARISHHYDWIVRTMCSMNPDGVPQYVDCEGIPFDELGDESSTQNPTGASSSGDSVDSSSSSSSVSSSADSYNSDEAAIQTGTQNPTASSSSSTSYLVSDDDGAFARAWWISDPFGA